MEGLLNLENFVEFTPAQFDILSHILTIGYAAHFAALAYFVLTRGQVAPKYRPMGTMSVVVMVSAALLLLRLDISFQQAFVFDGANYIPAAQAGIEDAMAYSHGYRYLNWLIDVPLLLTQSIYVLYIAREKQFGMRVKLAGSGAAMVILGYVGQFWEATDVTPLLIWGFLSTLPYLYFAYIFLNITGDAVTKLPGEAAVTMRNIRYLFIGAWGLYPIAYLVPAFELTVMDGVSAEGAVTRTLLFTVADVLSKIFYGVLLGKVAQIRSREEGYVPMDDPQAQRS